MKIGVLGLQGAVREHVRSLEAIGVDVRVVKRRDELEGLEGLVLPGGESTTISLLADGPFLERLRALAADGFPMFGTCAGMILLATDVDGARSPGIRAIDIAVARNASGRQVDSFEAELNVEGIGPFLAVFIRAPYIVALGDGVTPLATHDGAVVMARQGNVLVSSFHPELTDDTRIHRSFVKMVEQRRSQKEARR